MVSGNAVDACQDQRGGVLNGEPQSSPNKSSQAVVQREGESRMEVGRAKCCVG